MIHEAAIVSPGASIGSNVFVGPFTIIHDGVVIGDNTTIGSHCELGVAFVDVDEPLVIGPESLIRSHSILYAGSTIGSGFTTGHHVTVRERSTIGLNMQLGTLSDLQGDCIIGDYVRMHSNVNINKHTTIGNFVWLFPYAMTTNDPTPPSDTQMGCTIKDFASIAARAMLLPGVTVHEHALVGANSKVTRDVPAGMVATGDPAKVIGPASQLRLRDGTERPAYPWPTHFQRGYPAHVTADWH
jgi:acetyltransferase-like isoleucine patch superfamily enzyme